MWNIRNDFDSAQVLDLMWRLIQAPRVHNSTHLGGTHVNSLFHFIRSAAIPADSP